MTPARFEQLARGQTGVARKVLEAVPIQEPWSTSEIHREIYRVGVRIGVDVLEGCLKALRKSKLILEPQPGQFIRTGLRLVENGTATEEEDEDTEVQPKKAITPEAAFDKLARLATQMRVLTKEFEDTVLEVQAEIEQEREKTAKLRQLQAMLKELT